MTTANNIVAKASVAVVAVAMALSAFAPLAKAQTTDELQQMINDLLAQVAQLQGDLGTGATSAAGVCPYTWTRDLSSGSTGADVMKLQAFLNADPDTRVAAAGSIGSAGMETEYYGPATAAAVSKFQVKYRADILSPANLVNPTGYFGPSSRAKANALCVSAPVVDTPDVDEDEDMDEDMDEDEDEDEGPKTLGGEASLDSTDLDDEESSLEEGEEDVAVAVFTVEFQDGDAEISRIDISLEADGANAEDEPWEVFEEVSLWVDGDKVADVDASDEDEYLDEDAGEIRFSGLDLIAEEDEELEIVIAVSAQNNLDGMPSETWNVDVLTMRFFDADGVATTEDIAETAIEFDIEEAGANEELNISLASSNPDSADVVVDTDTDTDDVTILVAELEAEDNDIELNTVVVKVVTSASTTDVVDDIRLVIDGESFDAEAIGTEADYDAAADADPATGLTEGYSEYGAADEATVWYLFDIDGDVTLEEGDEVEMEVVVDLNDTDDGARYANGTTIEASITSVERDEWDAEGADDLGTSQFNGTAVGDAHTLVAEGILVPADGFTSEVDTLGSDDTIGEFILEFEVTAVEGDFYIAEAASTSADVSTGGVEFAYTGTLGTGSVSATLDSTADYSVDSAYTVREGETETFTLTVTIDPQNTGTFRVTLEEVWYSDDTDGITGSEAYTVTPATDFRSGSQAIQGGA